MKASISKNSNYEKYLSIIIFFATVVSFFVGFLLRENSAGGGLIDLSHEWHNYLLLKQDILGFLHGNYEASRFPLFHILNIYLNPFIYSQTDFINYFFIYSFILIFLFYYNLKKILKIKNSLIYLILSILLVSPYFRTSSFWGLQENLAYIFLLSTILINNEFKNKYIILFFSFLSFYSDQKFILVPIIFFLLLCNTNKIFSLNNLKLFFYCLLLFLPALFIFYEWGGVTKSGLNESAFRPQNLLFSITIISLYLVPFFYLFSDKKKILQFLKKNILFNFFLFFLFYVFIRLFYLDIELPISGGWAFKIYKILININFIFAEIVFFLICFFSYIIVFAYFKFFNISFVSKIIILFLVSYSVFIEIVFQEYFDPLILILCIFFFHKEQFQKITFQKSLILYSYFLIFWLGTLFYYHFYIF